MMVVMMVVMVMVMMMAPCAIASLGSRWRRSWHHESCCQASSGQCGDERGDHEIPLESSENRTPHN